MTRSIRSRSPEYLAWAAMIQRCNNERNPAYADYGGRGIRVCVGWRADFDQFLRDLGERPASLSLDRRDNDGHYSCGHCQECEDNGWPMNCRWATWDEQAANRRSAIVVEIDGVSRSVTDWIRTLGVNESTVFGRIFRGWPPREALTLPLNTWLSHKKRCSACGNRGHNRRTCAAANDDVKETG